MWLLLWAQREIDWEEDVESTFNCGSRTPKKKKKRASEKPAGSYCRQYGFCFGPEIEEERERERQGAWP